MPKAPAWLVCQVLSWMHPEQLPQDLDLERLCPAPIAWLQLPAGSHDTHRLAHQHPQAENHGRSFVQSRASRIRIQAI